MPPRNDRGARNGLIDLVSTGVGAAAEYREHRRQRTLLRASSCQDLQMSTIESLTSGSIAALHTVGRGPENLLEYTALAEGASSAGDASCSSTHNNLCNDMYDGNMLEDDEADWELDDMIQQGHFPSTLPSYAQAQAQHCKSKNLAHESTSTGRAVLDIPRLRRPLPLPVIIPQRRPRARARGFIRAYAPVLDDCGINEATFLAFLDDFYKSTQVSCLFIVIQITAILAGFTPDLTTQVVLMGIQVAAAAAAEAQGRQRTNTFLDRMNEELFRPAGLYALIMKYKPEANLTDDSEATVVSCGSSMRSEIVDLSTIEIVAKYGRTLCEPSDEKAPRNRRANFVVSINGKDFRLASGQTHGSTNLPNAAPLTFPDIDEAFARDKETFKDKAKDTQSFLADYLDRRAQMRYARDDPDSRLALSETHWVFKAELADPEHSLYQGGILHLASGGKLAPRAAKRDDKMRDEGKGKQVSSGVEQQPTQCDLVTEGISAMHHDSSREQSHNHSNLLWKKGIGGLVVLPAAGRPRARSSGAVHGWVARVGTSASSIGSTVMTPRGRSRPPLFHTSTAPAQAGEAGKFKPKEDEKTDVACSAMSAMYDKYGKRYARGTVGAVKRLLREDVLYLMIVNRPSDAELAVARAAAKQVKLPHHEQAYDGT
ncbi:hypothetical protein LTR56_017041 [Elasticomyces elasticus]|nr:hypothetical protein LTR22_021633 [Elasticomyces elasticus]KAK3631140.1 hypothetical protein LTR56_017041 [Elasticomyces elasticus]KAK4912652.1 hypothetical protein LTR49_018921 [Elasticomyces elasticus]KAK5752126.1 hypothetical protein LTS12_017805 [Elasticomyces elasticus]